MGDIKTFMQSALARPKGFEKPIPIVPFADWDYYYISSDLDWKPDGASEANLQSVHVPTGFVTDLTSIPRLFWSVLPPAAAYAYAAIIHDYLYWFQPCERNAADDTLRAGMGDLKVSSAKAFVIYNAVRLAGGLAWSANREARTRGERRILAKFPPDMTTSWADWKSHIDVFAPA
ncbi:MAG TPA: DUF1353 domain-containing protein [Xanthobacteraceae bacterium]|nr:DUF1353 domain-containing protein [Xanthobacteraceae bacterium]